MANDSTEKTGQKDYKSKVSSFPCITAMSLKRDARIAAILHTHETIQDLLNVPEKRPKPAEAPPLLGKRVPMLYGIESDQDQELVMRAATPTLWVTRRQVLHGQCMICMNDCIDMPEMALFTGNGNHSAKCPLTQPGTLCFSCATRTIGTSWNKWRQHPTCPHCRTPINESTVIRVCVR